MLESLSKRWKRLTEREIIMYDLHDGTTITDFELPASSANVCERMRPVATAIVRKKSPFRRQWRVVEGSKRMVPPQS